MSIDWTPEERISAAINALETIRGQRLVDPAVVEEAVFMLAMPPQFLNANLDKLAKYIEDKR